MQMKLWVVGAFGLAIISGGSAWGQESAPVAVPVEMQKPIPIQAAPLDGPGLVYLTFKAQYGFAMSQTELGEAYLGHRGQGVPTDYVRAQAWLLKAANQGFDGAETELGIMYQDGDGVPADNATSAAWFQKAADQGWGYAQYRLGELYDKGLGVAQDNVQAYRWYGLSAQSTRGQLFDDADVEARDAIAVKMAAAQIAQAQGLISAWKPAAETPDQQATRGVETHDRQEYADALAVLKPLAENGNALAQFTMGTMYEYGDGVTADPATAAGWYRKAADQGHVGAQMALGGMYNDGRGVAKDDHEAFVWIHAAADQGLAVTQAVLGAKYGQGIGVARNDATAAEWFRKAADQGDDLGQYLLGFAYATGRGVPKDPVQAYKWEALVISYSRNPEAREMATKARDALATVMSAAQVAEATQQVKAFFPVFAKP